MAKNKKKDKWQVWILGATNMPEKEQKDLEKDLKKVMAKYSTWTQDLTTDSGEL